MPCDMPACPCRSAISIARRLKRLQPFWPLSSSCQISSASVELWDDADSHVEELIALTGDYRVARAAFDEAVKCRPGRIVTLRQKTRLLADSRRKN